MKSGNCDEDVDLYDGLPDFNMEASLEKLEAENKELTLKVTDLLSRVTELETQNTELSRMNKNLKANISALVNTVQKEIQRKDKTINELRQEREDLFFRRRKPFNRGTRTHRPEEKNSDQPIDESRNPTSDGKSQPRKDSSASVGKSSSLPEIATRRNHSSRERKSSEKVAAKKTDEESLPAAQAKITNANSASESQKDSSSNVKPEQLSPPLSSTEQKELGSRPKTPTIYRLIPLPQPNESKGDSPAKRATTTLTENRSESKKTEAETLSPAKAKLNGGNRDGVVRISGGKCLVDPRISRNKSGDATLPPKENLDTSSGETKETPSTEHTSLANWTSPQKRLRKPKSTRLYVKTRSSARLSAKITAQETSNEGDVSVLEALQLEEKIPNEFANSPMPEILSPIVSFQDNEKSLSPLRFPAGLILSGPSSLPSNTPVSGMSSLLEGVLKGFDASSRRALHTPPRTERKSSQMQESPSRVTVTSDKSQTNTSQGEEFLSGEQGNVPGKADLVGEDAVRGGLGTKPVSIEVDVPCKKENRYQDRNGGNNEASRLDRRHDTENMYSNENLSKEECTRTSRLSLKGIGKRKEETASKLEVKRNEDKKIEDDSRMCASNEEREKSRKEEDLRNGQPNNEETRKEGAEPNGELKRKETSLKGDAERVDEPRKVIEAKCNGELKKEEFYKATAVRHEELRKNGAGRFEVPRKELTGGNGSDVTKRSSDSSALQCDFAVRRRTKVLLKIMVKTPPNTPNDKCEGELSKDPLKSPCSISTNQTLSGVVSRSNHKDRETPPQKPCVENKVSEKTLRDESTSQVSKMRQKSPPHHSKKAYVKYLNDMNKRSWNEVRRRSRSRSRPRYNSRENFPPARPNHPQNRHPRGFRSPPPRYRPSRRDDFKPHGFKFDRRSRSLSPRLALRQRYQRREERICPARLPADKKEREVLLFGTSPDRSPAKSNPPQRPVVFTVNIRRKKNVQLEDEEVKKSSPVPKPALSSSSQLVKTPIDFRERYAEVFSNTGESSDSESGAFTSESESAHSRDSDDSYRPKKKRKGGSKKQSKSKKRRKDDGEECL